MPYKNGADATANKRWKHRMRQLDRFREMGLEPLDANDPNSPLQCQDCGKQTGRSSAHIYRHHEVCWRYEQPPFWDRKSVTV